MNYETNTESKVWQKPLVPTTTKSRSYSEAKKTSYQTDLMLS